MAPRHHETQSRVFIDMTYVATLISASRDAALGDAIGLARHLLGAEAAPDWLDRDVAADILFVPPDGNPKALADRLRLAFSDRAIDLVVQPVANRRKRLFLADMDSTMIGQECIDELADVVGQKARVAAITERAMRGEIEFAPALIERVALLAGLSADVINDVITQRIRLTPGARTLVMTMRADGAYTCLVSGGFTLFTGKIAAMIGFDEARSNELAIDHDGRLTGRVIEPILGRDAKLSALIELRARLGLGNAHTLAVGDGANDLAMIAEAGLGVAYHAKPAVAEAAAARIDHCDLTALLYAQGYRRAEFVTG
jgi:phosphoserine phosphatase